METGHLVSMALIKLTDCILLLSDFSREEMDKYLVSLDKITMADERNGSTHIYLSEVVFGGLLTGVWVTQRQPHHKKALPARVTTHESCIPGVP